MNIFEDVDLKKVYKTYKKAARLKREAVYVNAVDGITFTVERGTICGLLGPNGAGKSTTVKMLCGALFPTGGSLTCLGFNPARDRRRYVARIGAVFGRSRS